MKKLIYLILILFSLSCSKTENSLEYEKDVMIKLLPDLVDSIFSDIRTSKLPSTPYLKKGISDSLKRKIIKRHQKH